MIKKRLFNVGVAVGLALLAFLLANYALPLILNRGENKEEDKPLYDFDNLIVNIDGAKRISFLALKLSAKTSSEAVSKEIAKKKTELVDMLINLLSRKTAQEIGTVEGKAKLKAEIIEKLNQKLTKGRIEAIYFTEFVIQ